MTSAPCKAFIVKVGVYGSILSGSWKDLKLLATKYTWYYSLSKLCGRLGIELELDVTYRIKPVEQGDLSLVDVTFERGHRGNILEI